MQKLSQTEELARSLAAKAHRHTLTTEQILSLIHISEPTRH